MTPDVAQRPTSTKVVRWLPAEPFAHFEDIHRRMNQLIHQLTTTPVGTGWTPAVDIVDPDADLAAGPDTSSGGQP